MTSLHPVNHFTKTLLLLALCCACVIGLIQTAQHYFVLSNLVWIALLYYVLLSYITFRITHSSINKDNKTFFTRTYSAIGIRFLFSLFPLILYMLFSPSVSLPLVVVYLLFYLLFTSFEIYFLVVNLRPVLKPLSPDVAE